MLLTPQDMETHMAHLECCKMVTIITGFIQKYKTWNSFYVLIKFNFKTQLNFLLTLLFNSPHILRTTKITDIKFGKAVCFWLTRSMKLQLVWTIWKQNLMKFRVRLKFKKNNKKSIWSKNLFVRLWRVKDCLPLRNTSQVNLQQGQIYWKQLT